MLKKIFLTRFCLALVLVKLALIRARLEAAVVFRTPRSNLVENSPKLIFLLEIIRRANRRDKDNPLYQY